MKKKNRLRTKYHVNGYKKAERLLRRSYDEMIGTGYFFGTFAEFLIALIANDQKKKKKKRKNLAGLKTDYMKTFLKKNIYTRIELSDGWHVFYNGALFVAQDQTGTVLYFDDELSACLDYVTFQRSKTTNF